MTRKLEKSIKISRLQSHIRDKMRSINENTLNEWKHSQAIKTRVC